MDFDHNWGGGGQPEPYTYCKTPLFLSTVPGGGTVSLQMDFLSCHLIIAAAQPTDKDFLLLFSFSTPATWSNHSAAQGYMVTCQCSEQFM